MSEVTLNKDKFRKWLESQPEGTIVGIVQSCGRCPIAQYLNEEFSILDNNNWWMVTTNSFYPHNYNLGHIQPLPNWAINFVDEIDRSVGLINKQVSRESCLEVLCQIKL